MVWFLEKSAVEEQAECQEKQGRWLSTLVVYSGEQAFLSGLLV